MSESVREAVHPCRVSNEFRVWVGLSSPSRGLQGAPSTATATVTLPHRMFKQAPFQHTNEPMALATTKTWTQNGTAVSHTYTYTPSHEKCMHTQTHVQPHAQLCSS